MTFFGVFIYRGAISLFIYIYLYISTEGNVTPVEPPVEPPVVTPGKPAAAAVVYGSTVDNLLDKKESLIDATKKASNYNSMVNGTKRYYNVGLEDTYTIGKNVFGAIRSVPFGGKKSKKKSKKNKKTKKNKSRKIRAKKRTT
jgi:hypothetical protein